MNVDTKTLGSTVTLMDIARAAGVSRTTVSNAFNRPDQLSTELRERILDVAASMGYAGPNPMARMLRKGRTGSLGLIFPKAISHLFTDDASVHFMRGIAEVCGREGLGLLLLPAHNEAAMLESLQNAAVDGFIVQCLAADDRVIRHVFSRNLPVVAVDLPDKALGYDAIFVGVDDRGGARQAADHLIKLGHRRIGVLTLELRADKRTGSIDPARWTGASYAVAMQRLLGYGDAFRAAGLDPATLMVEECRGIEPITARRGTRALLARNDPPTAILAMSDLLAFEAIETAREMGWSVPDDLSVIGFDDIPAAADASPALTTVNQPLTEKGRRAVQALISQDGEANDVCLATRLVVRATTAPARR